MITIRLYTPEDAICTGQLIADVYEKFNLDYLPKLERGPYLGPFLYAYSEQEHHKAAIASILKAQMMWVAVNSNNEIVGILRGSPQRLHSLFVREDHHGIGIGRMLTETFEQACRELGSTKITLAASLYAVPFYQRLGYKKSTGQRKGYSFNGAGFPFQPMKKILSN
jgi:GNAT superfamily N-acetyltransferase